MPFSSYKTSEIDGKYIAFTANGGRMTLKGLTNLLKAANNNATIDIEINSAATNE